MFKPFGFQLGTGTAGPNFAPTASNVLISGVFEVGETLTASYDYFDANGHPESGSIYQWYRAEDDAGLNEEAIVGANSLTYDLTEDDFFMYIRFGVIPSDGTLFGPEAFSASGFVAWIMDAVGFYTEDTDFTLQYATYLQSANITAIGDAVGFIRNALPATEKFLILSGAANTYASTPYSAGNTITGDITFEGSNALRSWAGAAIQILAAKWVGTGNQRCVQVGIVNATGVMRIQVSATGSATVVTFDSTVAPTTTSGGTLTWRIRLDVDDGASNSQAIFETWNGTTWVQLGDPVAGGATVSIFNSTSAPWEVGSQNAGTSGNSSGKFYYLKVYAGFNADTLKVSMDADDYTSGATWTSALTGATWTLNGVALIVPNELQFYQTGSTARPLAAQWPMTGVLNLLASGGAGSESFANWTASRSTVTAGADGIFASLAPTTENNVHFLQCATLPVISGRTYTYFVIAKPGVDDWVQLTFQNGFDAANLWASVDTSDGTIGNKGSSTDATSEAVPASLVAQYPELSGAFGFRMESAANATSSTSGFLMFLTDNTNAASRNPSYVGTITDTVLLTRAMMVEGDWTFADYWADYQKVISRANVQQDGVALVKGWVFDGTDDLLNSGVTKFGGSSLEAIAGNEATIAFCINVLPGNSGTIAGQCGTTEANQTFRMFVGTDGLVDVISRGTANADLGTIANGANHYIIARINGATLTLMVDSLTKQTLNVGTATFELLQTITMFAHNNATATGFLNGRLLADGWVNINRAMSDTELNNLMQYAFANLGVTQI